MGAPRPVTKRRGAFHHSSIPAGAPHPTACSLCALRSWCACARTLPACGAPALAPCRIAGLPQYIPGCALGYAHAPAPVAVPYPACAGHDWAGRGQNGGPLFSGGGPLGGLPAPAGNAICSARAFLNPARSSWTHIMETPIASATAAFLEHSRLPATTYSTLV